MGILKPGLRPPVRFLGVFALSLTLAGGGCVLLEQFGLSGRPPIFSHTNHTEKEDLQCKDCHHTFATAESAGMPRRKLCILCHEGIDEDKPAEKKVANMFADPPPWSKVTALPRDMIFSHKAHHDAKIGCAECHGDVEKIADCEKSEDVLRVTMRTCVECHARQPLSEEVTAAPAAPPGPPEGSVPKRVSRAQQVANNCAVCHREIRKDRPPESHEFADDRPPRNHRSAWKLLHGQAAKAHSGKTRERCDLCHQDSFCSDCHREEVPASHTVFWKERGHGIAVGMDRNTCAVCHTSDACDRCHRETEPRSHAGAWGGRRSNHCLSCHGLARGEGCGMCHRGAPSHTLAEPKPSWHSTGMNCRSCHFPTPHADNGMDCNACHR
jgi:hypothetical protein